MEVRKMKAKKLISLGLAAAMAMSLAACGGGGGNAEKSDAGSSAGAESNTGSSAAGGSGTGGAAEGVPTIDQIKVGEDYQDLTASIKVLTNRTDIVDTVYKGYADEFMKLYPNITVSMRVSPILRNP